MRKRHVLHRTLPWSAALACLAAVSLPAQAAEDSPPLIGINLTGVNYYTRELPFIDVMKGAGWNNGEPFEYVGNPQVREDGYPVSISGGQEAYRLFDKPVGVDGGRYVLLYDGTGEVSIGSNHTTSGRATIDFPGPSDKERTFIRIRRSDASDPVRNMRLVPSAYESTYRQGEPDNPFRPEFLDSWDMMEGHRFMDWGDTNGNPMSEWSERTLPTDSTQAGDKGVALEYQIQLANQAKKQPWFCVPHLASDDYIRQMATKLRDTLDPGLTARIEYSNEVWNGQFDQAQYALEKGRELEPWRDDRDAWIGAQHWHAKRATEMFKIFEDVFTEGGANPAGMDRLRRVIGAQAGNSGMADKIMEYEDTADHVDAIAIAPYVQGVLRDQGEVDRIKRWTRQQRWDWYWGQFDEAVDRINRYAAKADQYGVDLFAYEGGQHLVAHGHLNQDQQINNILQDMNRDPEMREMYRRLLEEWEAAGGDDFFLFASTGSFGPFGSWGLREYEGQPLSETPKLQGVLDYLAGRPGDPGNGGNDDPSTPEGVLFADTFAISLTDAGSTGREGSSEAWQIGVDHLAGSEPLNVSEVLHVGTHNGKQVLVFEGNISNTPTDIKKVHLSRDVDTSEYEDVQLELKVAQNSSAEYDGFNEAPFDGTYWADFIEVLVDYGDGQGWQQVFIDDSAFDGYFDGFGDDSDPYGVGEAVTALIPLGELAADNPDLEVRVAFGSNSNDEKYYVESLRVLGTLVPEPGALGAMLVLGAPLLLRRRCRA
ncbi:MAG: hypothetical protein ACLFVN_10240 [Phycisphaeraceae bacterium]